MSTTRSGERWFVLAMDDAGVMTFATHRVFNNYETAVEYAKTVAHTRLPVVAYAEKAFYRKHE